MESFADWINRELWERKIKQADLARAIGITRSSVALYTTGRNSPSSETASKIATYFGLPEIEVLRYARIATARPTKSAFIEYVEERGDLLSEEDQEDVRALIEAVHRRASPVDNWRL